MARRVRVDQRVVELGLEATRSRAQARILAGDVRLGDRVLDKPGHLIPADSALELRERPRWVSRGGEKLAGALDALGIDPAGLRCADVGASTGGFTDCLLQHGARSVLAIDVGRGQLDARLRSDPRVTALERTNVRHFRLPAAEPRFDLVTADLAFISLRLVLPRLVDLAAPGGRLLLLVKPQFELGRAEVRGGVVRDPAARRTAVERVREAAGGLGLAAEGESESRLPGPKGNREIFLLLRRPRDGAGLHGIGAGLD
jgi:23S rRNA (cytidine1920-2'-O)/16S rRNA (cytidine1409-2'-O)-methyltransferase